MRNAAIIAMVVAATVSAQEPNTAGGRLEINGYDPGTYPISQVVIGPSITLEIGGGALLPYTLVTGPLNPANNLTLAGQFVDVGTPPAYADMNVVIDGTSPGASLLNLLAVLDVSGQSVWTLPSGPPQANVTFSLQGIVWDPGHPDSFDLTAANTYTLNACEGTDLGLGDDAFVQLFLNSWTFPFYGTTYTDVFVGSNGFVTMGSGDDDFSPSASEMLSGQPRIADLWIDLAPNEGGQNLWRDDTVSTATLCRVDVPLFSTARYNTLSLTLDNQGNVQIFFPGGQQEADTPLVGISPGGNLSMAPSLDVSAAHMFNGSMNMALYEFFNINNLFDLTATNVIFLPTAPSAYQVQVF